MLHDFSREYGYQAEKKDNVRPILNQEQKALHSFMYSLLPYEDLPASEEILKLKQKEALLLLLNYDPSLKDILFDFSEPYKIDIESFMNKNFHFNVNVERFAYLTGEVCLHLKGDFQRYSEFHKDSGCSFED